MEKIIKISHIQDSYQGNVQTDGGSLQVPFSGWESEGRIWPLTPSRQTYGIITINIVEWKVLKYFFLNYKWRVFP